MEGVAQIHSQNIVHRDLKHLNIFLTDSTDSPRVKIGDFGLACKLKPGQTFLMRVGSIAYMAPEVIEEEPSDFKADVWSLGVILYVLVGAQAPFIGLNFEDTRAKIKRQQISFE